MRGIAILFAACVSLPWGGMAAWAQSVNPRAAAPAHQASLRVAAELRDEQRDWLRRAWRHEKHGWIYLHIEGEPRERGFQHGYLLAKEIAKRLAAPSDRLEVRQRPWIGPGWSRRPRRCSCRSIDAENLAEIDGHRRGARPRPGFVTSRDEIIALQRHHRAWRATGGPRRRSSSAEDAKPPRRQSCSAFIATGSMTADGGIVLAHNTMGGYDRRVLQRDPRHPAGQGAPHPDAGRARAGSTAAPTSSSPTPAWSAPRRRSAASRGSTRRGFPSSSACAAPPRTLRRSTSGARS